MTLRVRSLSIIRIAPEMANQAKDETLGGALAFQALLKEIWVKESPSRIKKKEGTEKEPSTAPIHSLLSTPTSGMKNTFQTERHPPSFF